jgi:alanine racemase
MSVRLTVDRAAWRAHVQQVAAAYGPDLVPVVKGNGYGFGRNTLHHALVDGMVARGSFEFVAVGSVHELHDVPDAATPVVLTPTLAAPAVRRCILTVGAREHVDALDGWGGRVVVKLASSMRRYGVEREGLDALVERAHHRGLDVIAYALHLPLAGDDASRIEEISAWLPHLPPSAPVWVSHLAPDAFHALRAHHPRHDFRIRVGTRLWHGVPRGAFAHLDADVLQVRSIHEGEPAGYRLPFAPFDGTLVCIGAGSAHGVALLDDTDPTRRSPFHFQRARLTLLEPPHMHSTIAIVPAGEPCPEVGDRVDVQRPFISTWADEVDWQ